jgi:phenylacetic acid degradation operon negative regulatory protein
MPAASVSIHSMRRLSTILAGSGNRSSCDISVTMQSDSSRAGNVRPVNEQLRRRSVGASAARSVLLTLLGEYVLPASGSAWQETLIAALETLEHKHPAARRALARSVTAGWLRTERHGRRSRVHLTPATAEMLRAGTERIYSFGDPWEWDGRWLLVVLRVPETRRELRHQVRTRLAWAGFGSLGGGLWITPHVDRERELAGADAAAELLSFQAALGTLGDPAKLPAEAWDLDAVAAAYRDFAERFGRARPKTPAAVFRAQTQLVHEWRKFPFLDPDLPESVLPARWPRARALAVFRDRHDAWHATAQDWFHSLEALREAA